MKMQMNHLRGIPHCFTVSNFVAVIYWSQRKDISVVKTNSKTSLPSTAEPLKLIFAPLVHRPASKRHVWTEAACEDFYEIIAELPVEIYDFYLQERPPSSSFIVEKALRGDA